MKSLIEPDTSTFIQALELVLSAADKAAKKEGSKIKRYASLLAALGDTIKYIDKASPPEHPLRKYSVDDFEGFLIGGIELRAKYRLLRYCDVPENKFWREGGYLDFLRNVSKDHSRPAISVAYNVDMLEVPILFNTAVGHERPSREAYPLRDRSTPEHKNWQLEQVVKANPDLQSLATFRFDEFLGYYRPPCGAWPNPPSKDEIDQRDVLIGGRPSLSQFSPQVTIPTSLTGALPEEFVPDRRGAAPHRRRAAAQIRGNRLKS